MVGCKSLKKTSAVHPFPLVVARCLVRKRYTIWGGWGCTREGHESLGRRVAFQLVASSACWGSEGVVGLPVPAVGAVTQCVYTEKCMGTSEDKGTGLVTPCSQRNVFIPVVLSANFPSPSGHFCTIMAWGAGGGRGGQDILETLTSHVGEHSFWTSLSRQCWLISTGFSPGASCWVSSCSSVFMDCHPKLHSFCFWVFVSNACRTTAMFHCNLSAWCL